MAIHDGTRATAGTWHGFHLAWVAEIRNALNGGILPADSYAQAEQIAGPLGPDVTPRCSAPPAARPGSAVPLNRFNTGRTGG
jgi:hypothetical protein